MNDNYNLQASTLKDLLSPNLQFNNKPNVIIKK